MKRVFLMMMVVVALLLVGCSAAGVKNKYDQTGPSSSMTGPGTYTRTRITITKAGEKTVEKEVVEDEE